MNSKNLLKKLKKNKNEGLTRSGKTILKKFNFWSMRTKILFKKQTNKKKK